MTDKGTQHELDIEQQGRDRGYATLRAPGSGGGGDHNRPDVILLKGTFGYSEVYAFELKKRPDGTASFTQAEIDALTAWSKQAGAEPFVGVRPDRRRSGQVDRYLPVSTLHETDSGNYSLRKQDFDRCLSLDEVLR